MKILMVENKLVRTITFVIVSLWAVVILGVCGAYIVSSRSTPGMLVLAHLVFWSLLLSCVGFILSAINRAIGNSLKKSFEQKKKR